MNRHSLRWIPIVLLFGCAIVLTSCGGGGGGTTPTITAPSAPTGSSATAYNGQVNINWNSVAGATSYNIYWSTTNGVTKANGTKISNVSSPYPHQSLSNGTTYYYVVTAVSAGGESEESSQVGATPHIPVPGAPTGVSAIPGNAQNEIVWIGVPGATSYNIYWSTVSGVTKANGTKISGLTNIYTHSGLSNDTTYYYVVTAVGEGGESAESLQTSGRTKVAAPTGVSATAGNAQNTIVWNAVSGATSYNIDDLVRSHAA